MERSGLAKYFIFLIIDLYLLYYYINLLFFFVSYRTFWGHFEVVGPLPKELSSSKATQQCAQTPCKTYQCKCKFFPHPHLCVMGVFVKAAAWAADRTTSRRILVALPPFILDEPLMASGWTHTFTQGVKGQSTDTSPSWIWREQVAGCSYPNCWVNEEGLLAFGKLLHPLHHTAKSERAAGYGLVPKTSLF